ncbi:MAG: SUMF1/EgtB/PvdO family nonheme iron enzyme [Xanthomonadales bacterium]|nr:SUMF1/EgtB/PvdO family nonheme iron enzyme [Xanthomonadales bacterium]
MIRRVLSIVIGLAGALLLWSWWQRGHEPPTAPLSAPETVLATTDADEPVAAGQPEVAAATEPEPAQPQPDEVVLEPAVLAQVAAGWTPTRVEFDQSDRNGHIILLQRADAALAEGRLYLPPGDSAVDLYWSVLEAAPGNTRARDGLARVTDRLLADAEREAGRGDWPELARLLPVLEQLRPDAANLPALRDRFSAAAAPRLALERARRALARDRLDEGERNALGYLRQVLAVEPDSLAAQEGVAEIRTRLLAQSAEAAQAGEFEQAEALLARASAADPAALQALADAASTIAGARSAAAGRLLVQAHARLDAGDADAAEALLGQALAIDAEVVGPGLVRERIRNTRLYGGFAEGERFSEALADGGEGPVMVVIPLGSFLMGSPDGESGRRANEGPRFRVNFARAFALAEAEVTVAEFGRFVAATGHRTRAERRGSSTIYDERTGSMRERASVHWRHDEGGRPADPAQPVVHVAWADAAAYALWLAEQTGRPYRLPSEAEFEYGLRAGSNARYPWGDGPPPVPLANVSSTGDRSRLRREWSNAFPGESDGWFGIAPVRSFPANALGLHDMPGNASEWVEDCWHSTYSRAPSDGRAWVNPGCTRRVVRGGSWASGPDQVRSAYRLNIPADTTSPRVGFRVARTL